MNVSWLKELNDIKYDDIDYVCVHFEDCFACNAYNKCMTATSMEKFIPIFDCLIESFEDKGVKVETHRGTAQNNRNRPLTPPHHDTPQPMEVAVYLTGDDMEFIRLPHYNYFFIRYKDGSKEMHTVSIMDSVRDPEYKEGCDKKSVGCFQ